jgi:hypothetical protein
MLEWWHPNAHPANIPWRLLRARAGECGNPLRYRRLRPPTSVERRQPVPRRQTRDRHRIPLAPQRRRSHDFFSEGDYWWPDPKNPDGPYIQRDGLTNPDNFVDHRQYLMRLSVEVPALAAAWILTREKKYAAHAAAHLRAWFIDPATRMNPNLRYAQAIHGRFTGRGIGIIDTIHLVEVAHSIPTLADTLPTADTLPSRNGSPITSSG